MIAPKEIQFYTDSAGSTPFKKWLDNLRNREARQRVIVRLRRLEQGNYGNCEAVGEGVSELRMFFGSGYRVYFGEWENNIVVLLTGGDKKSQTKDVKKAKQYWQEYLSYAKDRNT